MRAFMDWRTYHVALIAMLEGTVSRTPCCKDAAHQPWLILLLHIS